MTYKPGDKVNAVNPRNRDEVIQVLITRGSESLHPTYSAIRADGTGPDLRIRECDITKLKPNA